MFIEPTMVSGQANRPAPAGWIEVVCGSMFSGKTEELLRRVNRARIAGQKIQIFKPAVDTRYHEYDVVSHNSNAVRSTPVQFSEDMLLLSSNADVVAIDEAQFFDEDLVEVCNKLANAGKRVLVAGLDMDFAGQPFGPMPQLMAIADYVTKVHAICVRCGNIAHYSYRKVADQKKVMLGETDSYEARCRRCFLLGPEAPQII